MQKQAAAFTCRHAPTDVHGHVLNKITLKMNTLIPQQPYTRRICGRVNNNMVGYDSPACGNIFSIRRHWWHFSSQSKISNFKNIVCHQQILFNEKKNCLNINFLNIQNDISDYSDAWKHNTDNSSHLVLDLGENIPFYAYD